MQTLRQEAGFQTLRDVLLFAAAVGHHEGRREPFTASGEPIRYEIMMDPIWAAPLLQMMATAAYPDDPEILAPSRIQEQVSVFEDYANGGLNYLQGELNVRRDSADVICASLVVDALADVDTAEGPSLVSLVNELTWGAS